LHGISNHLLVGVAVSKENPKPQSLIRSQKIVFKICCPLSRIGNIKEFRLPPIPSGFPHLKFALEQVQPEAA
jgi:hypothetical protein